MVMYTYCLRHLALDCRLLIKSTILLKNESKHSLLLLLGRRCSLVERLYQEILSSNCYSNGYTSTKKEQFNYT